MQVEREIQIHSQLDHENVVKLFAAFEDAENVYLAQEFAAGEACSMCMRPCNLASTAMNFSPASQAVTLAIL